MAVGDRVQHIHTARLGIVRRELYSATAFTGAIIEWDTMHRSQEAHERTASYDYSQFIYLNGEPGAPRRTAMQTMEAHEDARRQAMVVHVDMASEGDITSVSQWQHGLDDAISALHVTTLTRQQAIDIGIPVVEMETVRPEVDADSATLANQLVQKGGLIQALLNADRADIEAMRAIFQGVAGPQGPTGMIGAMGATGATGMAGPRGRNFDDPTEEEERAAREAQRAAMGVTTASALNKVMQPKRLAPKLFGGKRRVTGLD